MYDKVTKRWNEYSEAVTKCPKILKVYFDDILIDSLYVLDFKKQGILFDKELNLNIVSSEAIELKIHKRANVTRPKKIKIEYGMMINYSLRVEEVNSLTVAELNSLPIKRLFKDDIEEEIIPVGIYNIDDWNDEDDNVINIKALDNVILFK